MRPMIRLPSAVTARPAIKVVQAKTVGLPARLRDKTVRALRIILPVFRELKIFFMTLHILALSKLFIIITYLVPLLVYRAALDKFSFDVYNKSND